MNYCRIGLHKRYPFKIEKVARAILLFSRCSNCGKVKCREIDIQNINHIEKAIEYYQTKYSY